MPLEEPPGSSASSVPEEEEEAVASKQTHILEQVTKERVNPKIVLLLRYMLAFIIFEFVHEKVQFLLVLSL